MNDTPAPSLSVAEVRRLLNCSRERVHALIAAGVLESFTIPATGPFAAAIRILAESVFKLMRAEIPVESVPRKKPKPAQRPAVSDRVLKWFPEEANRRSSS